MDFTDTVHLMDLADARDVADVGSWESWEKFMSYSCRIASDNTIFFWRKWALGFKL